MHEIKQALTLKWWPSPQDYNEAIQNPHANLGDAELKACRVHVDKLGLPRPMTGAFASVYRLTAPKRDIAFRCFLRNIKDQEQRYGMISNFVQSDDLPYTVGCEFLRKGVAVNGRWFPALKMEYVEGVPLDAYVKQHANDAALIAKVADSFQIMCDDLRAAGIAHGDLQHGNILVLGDELRLVDYDGMFVPGMENMLSNEVGHPNYQHPDRCADDFGIHLDNFAAWVIYASLRALSLDPSLHRTLAVGDDCLLFRRDDYLNPEYSRAFFVLDNHKNEEIVALSRVVRFYLQQKVADVVALSRTLPEVGKLPRVNVPPAAAPGQAAAPRQALRAKLPDWMSGGTSAPSPARANPRQQAAPQPQQGQQPAMPWMPPGLTAPVPRKSTYNINCARINPWVLQIMMLFNPLVWMVIFHAGVGVPNDMKIVNYGFEYRAQVTHMQKHHTSKRDWYDVDYQYQVGNQTFTGEKEVSSADARAIGLQEGDHFRVRALPSNGNLHVADLPTSEGGTMGAAWHRVVGDVAVVGLLCAFNILLECLIWFTALKHKRLVKFGSVGRATITRKERITGSKQEVSYALCYRFHCNKGAIDAKMLVPESVFHGVKEKDRFTVLYDPAKPENSVIYDYSIFKAMP